MTVSRRRFATAVGATGIAAVAGCTGVPWGEDTAGDGADDETGDGPGGDETDDDARGFDAIDPDDWPSYQRTPGNRGVTDAPVAAADPSERWTIDLPGGVTDQVAIVDGTVYACTDAGTVHAIDAGSGDDVWSEPVDGATDQCPCVVDGLVVFGTDAGELVALDAADGDLEWSTALAGPVSGPTAAGGTVYAGTREEPTVTAVDAAGGEIEWTVDAPADVVDYPAVTRDRLYVAAEGEGLFQAWLRALDPADGDERWSREGARMLPPAATAREVVAPALDAVVYTPGGRETRMFSPSGHVIWTPAVTDEAYVAVGTGGILTATPRTDAGPDWLLDVDGRPLTGPAVAGDGVFLVDGERNLVAVSYAEGDVRWRRPLEGEFASTPAVGGGAVFVGTDAGTVHAFE